jgi:hypothetical protein
VIAKELYRTVQSVQRVVELYEAGLELERRDKLRNR